MCCALTNKRSSLFSLLDIDRTNKSLDCSQRLTLEYGGNFFFVFIFIIGFEHPIEKENPSNAHIYARLHYPIAQVLYVVVFIGKVDLLDRRRRREAGAASGCRAAGNNVAAEE